MRKTCRSGPLTEQQSFSTIHFLLDINRNSDKANVIRVIVRDILSKLIHPVFARFLHFFQTKF